MKQQLEEMQSDAFPSDIRAFCALVSRIILRCLRERDGRVLQILGLSSLTASQPQKGTANGNESAA